MSCKGIDLDKIIDKVDEIVKLLKKPGNFHKKFKSFLQNEQAQFSDVKYFTKVRWLSRGTFLKRFLDLLNEIDNFFSENKEKIPELSDPLWKFKLGFLVDITILLNILNTNLQGKQILIIDALSQIREFKIKLNNYISEVEQGHFFHFFNANLMYSDFDLKNDKNFDQAFFVDFLKRLLKNFEQRFHDLENEKIFDLFSIPFNIRYNELPDEFKKEIQLMYKGGFDLEFGKCSTNQDKIIFFKNLPENDNFNFRNNTLKVLSMFSSSYLCEQFFSLLKFRKNQYSSKLSEVNLENYLRISCSTSEPNYEQILNK